MKKLRNFLEWYRRYRTSQIMVLHLGRWESFCRALEWTFRGKK